MVGENESEDVTRFQAGNRRDSRQEIEDSHGKKKTVRVRSPEEIGCKRFGRLPSDNSDICPGLECSAFFECLEEMLWRVDIRLAHADDPEGSISEKEKEEISRRASEILGAIESLAMQAPPNFTDEHISEIAELKVDIVDDLPYGVVLLSREGKPTVHNISGIRFYRDICTCQGDLTDEGCPIHVCLRQITSGNRQITLQELKKDERIYEIRFSRVPLIVSKEYGAVLTIRDVTQQKFTEHQILQGSKMTAIGELAAAVAHEISSFLTPAVSLSELWLTREIQDDKLKSDIERIYTASSRAAGIVRNLLLFSKDQEQVSKTPLSINEAVENSLKLVRSYCEKGNIVLDEDLAGALPPIFANRYQIQHIVLNLVTNAMDAILESGKGGNITIRTKQLEGNVLLEVSDDSCGIPENLQDRVFEPFVTTKSPDKGTGIGLFLTYNIVKGHSGKISLTSQEGKGTTFKTEFPAMSTGVPAR